MGSADDLADSTDWLSTSIPLLAPFESSLRCQVCKDLFNTPMMTTCSHTFCSLCIRRCLESDGRCPTCREQDQPSKLRKNGTVQNIVDLFQEARAQTLAVARGFKELEAGQQSNAGAGRKRKRVGTDGAEDAHGSQKSVRQTRSSTRRDAEPPASQDAITTDGEDDGDYLPQTEEEARVVEAANDGLVPCPMCSLRMKEEAMWAHLDKCDGTAPRQQSSMQPPRPTPQRQVSGRPPLPAHNIDRLPQPNFRLLKDAQLKKKLGDFGVPAWGDRQLLQRRYTEWVNLYNSNADSSRPRSTRELLRDLDTWERSQGGRATTRDAKTKDKDFDGQAWARENRDQFADLVAQARSKRKATAAEDSEQEREANTSSSQSTRSALKTPIAEPSPGSVVIKRSSATVTASADPVVAEASCEPQSHEVEAEQSSSGSQQPNKEADVDVALAQAMPSSHPSPKGYALPPAVQRIPDSPVQKMPMFTLPESSFTDGDGVEMGGS